MRPTPSIASAILTLLAASCVTTPPARGKVDFAREVKPLLEARCLPCHRGDALPGLPDFRDRAGMIGAGYLVPGNAAASRVIQVTQLRDDQIGAMPPTGHALAASEIELLTRWIDEGADWPEGEQLHQKRGAEPRSR
ncbi:MAG: c-type cytochrome domain-containing protein [Verrucomicrobiales bacterium]